MNAPKTGLPSIPNAPRGSITGAQGNSQKFCSNQVEDLQGASSPDGTQIMT